MAGCSVVFAAAGLAFVNHDIASMPAALGALALVGGAAAGAVERAAILDPFRIDRDHFRQHLLHVLLLIAGFLPLVAAPAGFAAASSVARRAPGGSGRLSDDGHGSICHPPVMGLLLLRLNEGLAPRPALVDELGHVASGRLVPGSEPRGLVLLGGVELSDQFGQFVSAITGAFPFEKDLREARADLGFDHVCATVGIGAP